jgi:hypothetical protein
LETLKFCELVAVPFGVVTCSAPFLAPLGTLAVTCVSVTETGVVDTPPPNFTCDAPARCEPLIATVVPTGPEVGEIDEIEGAAVVVTVKTPELVPVPPGPVTPTTPVDAPPGTVAVMEVSLATVKVAGVPLNVTAVAPVKFEPLIVTCVPAGP